MTLEQLRIFVAVAEREHVTQAAQKLNLTQSATSAAVAALEARYDIKLFDRVGRGIVLTHAGRSFLAEARAVLARTAMAEQSLHDLAGLRRGYINVAASQTVGNYWLPSRLAAFRTQHPGIDLHLTIGNTEQVAQAVSDGRADFGFVEGRISDPVLTIRRIGGDHLIVVVGRRHPWARQPKVPAKALTTTGWVLREPGSGTRSMFESALRRFGLKLADLTVEMELPSNEAIRAAVETGASATALSHLVAAPSLAAKTLHHVEIALQERPFYLLRHKQKHLSRADAAFVESLQP